MATALLFGGSFQFCSSADRASPEQSGQMSANRQMVEKNVCKPVFLVNRDIRRSHFGKGVPKCIATDVLTDGWEGRGCRGTHDVHPCLCVPWGATQKCRLHFQSKSCHRVGLEAALRIQGCLEGLGIF